MKIDLCGDIVTTQGCLDSLVICHRGQQPLVDGLAWVNLLNNSQYTVVQMLVECLSVGKDDTTSRTRASYLLVSISAACSRALSSRVWCSLLDTMDRGQMSLEDICAVETLLTRTTTARTEPANHCSFIVSQCVPVLVVFAGEPLDVVVTGWNRALFWSFVLVCEHVRLEVFDVSAT